MSYLSGFPPTLVYPGLSGYTEADFTKAIQELHSIAASIADSKQRYKQTGDVRYLQSVQTMAPYFQRAMEKAQTINQQLYDQDLPSGFSTFLADTLSWITDTIAQVGGIGKTALTTVGKVVEATGDTAKQVPKLAGNLFSLPVLLLIGGAAFLFAGGAKFLPKRKEQ